MEAARKLDLLDDPAAAAAVLDPFRQKLVSALDQPRSAATLAREMGLPRQKINYHLRELEKVGLVSCVEERKKGNCTERLVRATARHYLVDPGVLGELAAQPTDVRDTLSWRYLVALAARTIRELAVLRRRADAVGKPLQTLGLEATVCFSSQHELHAFSEELCNEVVRLATKYDAPDVQGGRAFRFVLGAYPKSTESEAA